MAMPPAWKVKRELRSALDQLKAWGLQLISPVRRIFYNRRELTEIQVHEGQRSLNNKLVIYLVYQPKGLEESNFIAINHIVSEGHEVLLVSNGSLASNDLNRLKTVCWRVLERENLGYDFGGYRCGLHYLKNLNILPDMLSLINDSIWFPIIEGSDLLAKTERTVTDFGGAVCFDDSGSRNKGKLVLSYWLTVRGALLRSNVFWGYWKRYLPSSNKTLAVKLGERGLSRIMSQYDRNIESVFTLGNFLFSMQKANIRQLELTLKYAAFTDLVFQNECQKILESVEESYIWKKNCLEFIEKVSRRRNFLHSFCYPSIAILQVPFIKKNQLRLQVLMRLQYLRAIDLGDLPAPNLAILEEIRKNTNIKNLI